MLYKTPDGRYALLRCSWDASAGRRNPVSARYKRQEASASGWIIGGVIAVV